MKTVVVISVLVAALVLALVAVKNTAPVEAAPKGLLKIGSPAPNFTLPSTNGTITLSKLLNASSGQHGEQYAVLVFYPMDNTPGCTVQLCSLRDTYAQLQKKHITVVGMNPADVKSHAGFAKKQHYAFPLASDTNRAVAKAYGVGGVLGVNNRTVIVVSPQQTIVFAEEGMPTPEDIMAAVYKHRH